MLYPRAMPRMTSSWSLSDEIDKSSLPRAEPDAREVSAPEVAPVPVTSVLDRVIAYLHRLGCWINRPWFAYPALLLLQIRVMWGDWSYRDLTSGDTSSYFVAAYRWYRDFTVDLVWSPLYTAFYGSL